MSDIRCPYCHDFVPARDFPAHEAAHRAPKADGQQSAYVTLPDAMRDESDLDGVPVVYVHDACGVGTQMPEDIVRSYLVNPYLYMADATFCCGCGRHVPYRECRWVETGEDLQTYFNRLRAGKPHLKPKGCLGVVLLGVVAAWAAWWTA